MCCSHLLSIWSHYCFQEDTALAAAFFSLCLDPPPGSGSLESLPCHSHSHSPVSRDAVNCHNHWTAFSESLKEKWILEWAFSLVVDTPVSHIRIPRFGSQLWLLANADSWEALLPTGKTWIESRVHGFGLAQSWLLWAFGVWTESSTLVSVFVF